MNISESAGFDNIDHFRRTNDSSARLAIRVPSPLKTQKSIGKFLKGPISLSWLTTAAKQPGKAALVTGVALWYLAGLRKSMQVQLSNKVMHQFGSSRKVKSRGLKLLEEAKLVRVDQIPRKSPLVTILSEE